ncbi:cytochrome b/b6 domain-containing protein [Lutibacter sp.]
MKSYIWTLPTRISHWLLAASFTIAYILGDFENLANFHFAFGAFAGTLIFFRLLFGLFGPKYSNFKDFSLGIKNQILFIKTYFSNPKEYAGHNPVASIIMLLILIIGLLTAASGFMTYASESNLFNIGINEHFFEEIHETMANIFLTLVIIHLIGVFSDRFFHSKTGTLKSIFTGYKNVEAENATLNSFHKSFILIGFLASFFAAYLAFNLPIEESESGHKIEKNEHHDDDDDDD